MTSSLLLALAIAAADPPNAAKANDRLLALMLWPWNITASVSGLYRLPRHVSHSTHTSGRKCISIRRWPFPSHASQRPPGTLKLNRRAE